MSTGKNYTNVKLGMLTLIKRVGTNEHGSAVWEYICDCGKKGEISTQCFKIVLHHSCGCNSKFNVNHRVKNHTLLKAFRSMHNRCYDIQDKSYHNYGGRGISVCDRWHDFNNYYDDIIGLWKKGLWADRIDNNKGYEPSNFRWVTPKESGRNTRAVKLSVEKVKFIKESNLSHKELAKMFDVHYETIRQLRVYNKNWND